MTDLNLLGKQAVAAKYEMQLLGTQEKNHGLLKAAEKLLEKQPQEDIIMCEYIDLLEARGEARGKALGEASGEAKLTLLLETLYDQGRDDEAKLAVRDMDVRAELYRELRIPNYTYEAQT